MTLCLKKFTDEFMEIARDIAIFIKKEKALRWYIACLILFFWGAKAVNGDIFIDSEVMTLQPYALLQSWYGSKRFGLIFTKRLFHMIRLVPFLSNVLFAFTLWGIVIFLCYCLTRWFRPDGRLALFLFAGIFISCPSLAEQYAYTLQAFEITLAMGFCIAAAFGGGLAVYEGKSGLWYLFSLGFLVWSLGSYQGFCTFYIVLVLISFVGMYEQKNGEHAFRYGVRQVLLFIAGFVCYAIIGEVLCRLKGGDSSYVEAMFWWGRVSTAECLQYILDEFRCLYCGVVPVLYNRFFGFFVLAGGILLVARGFRKGFCNMFWYVTAIVLLAVSPMIVTVLTGMRTPVRGQLAFPLVLAFFSVALWYMLCNLVSMWGRDRSASGQKSVGAGFWRRPVCLICTVLLFYQVWVQGMDLNQLNQTLHDTVNHDILTAERMYTDICKVADRSDMQNCRVVLVGTRDARMPGAAARGESIGHSYFDFGITHIGVTDRVTGLFNMLGMNVGGASSEDYQAAMAAAEGRDCWPASESVFKLSEDCIVVKLSE